MRFHSRSQGENFFFSKNVSLPRGHIRSLAAEAESRRCRFPCQQKLLHFAKTSVRSSIPSGSCGGARKLGDSTLTVNGKLAFVQKNFFSAGISNKKQRQTLSHTVYLCLSLFIFSICYMRTTKVSPGWSEPPLLLFQRIKSCGFTLYFRAMLHMLSPDCTVCVACRTLFSARGRLAAGVLAAGVLLFSAVCERRGTSTVAPAFKVTP